MADDTSSAAGPPLVASGTRSLVRSRRLPDLPALVARYKLVAATIASLGVVLALSVWSSALERDAVFADFSHEQAVLATAVSVNFEHRHHVLLERRAARGVPADQPLVDDEVLSLVVGARKLEDRGELMVLVARPRETGFLAADRRVIPSARLRAALDAHATVAELPRDEAVGFGLPHRRAIAGLARVPSHRFQGEWGIVVLASTERLRTRERHEEIRLVVTLLVAAGVVTAFGVVSLRKQRAELDMARRAALDAFQREREALLARADKMAALAALSTGIAHEVGTPLGVIVGRVEQVSSRPGLDDRTRHALGVVTEQVERIQRIVRGCLALARGDAPQLVKVPARDLALRAVDLVRHRFEQAGVVLESRVDDVLPEVACEPSLFEQALVNVLLNACHASPGGARVVLSAERAERQVRFVVDDEGAGIPADVAARATEPFFSTKRDQGGSGLGLTIAREIVTHHGGVLTLGRRADGAGTRATLTVLTA